MSTPESLPRRCPRVPWRPRPEARILTLIVLLGWVLAAPAEVVWESRALELEAAPGSAQVEGRFRFTNRGPEAVRITSVRTSCGCTTAALEKKEYAAGEQGELVATLHSDALGATRKSLYVFLVQGEAPEASVELTLTMVRREYVRVTPELLLWRDSQQPLGAQTATLTVVHDQPIHLAGVTANGEGFAAELRTLEAGRRYELVVTPTVTKGPAYASLAVGSDFPAGQPIDFTVGVRVLGKPLASAEPRWRRALLWVLELVP